MGCDWSAPSTVHAEPGPAIENRTKLGAPPSWFLFVNMKYDCLTAPPRPHVPGWIFFVLGRLGICRSQPFVGARSALPTTRTRTCGSMAGVVDWWIGAWGLV